jgi:hypothetical protein
MSEGDHDQEDFAPRAASIFFLVSWQNFDEDLSVCPLVSGLAPFRSSPYSGLPVPPQLIMFTPPTQWLAGVSATPNPFSYPATEVARRLSRDGGAAFGWVEVEGLVDWTRFIRLA